MGTPLFFFFILLFFHILSLSFRFIGPYEPKKNAVSEAQSDSGACGPGFDTQSGEILAKV